MSTTNHKTIHAKLNQARKDFHAKTHDKTGKHVNYMYFELSDFLPDALKAFDDAGICGIVSFGAEEARMKIVDVETKEVEVITTPMSTATLVGCSPVQNLGAVQTYLRRYLWSCAIELVEADKVEASVKEDETLPKDKFVEKKFPALVKAQTKPPASPGASERWLGKIAKVNRYQSESMKNPMWWIEMENGESAGTFKEEHANDARIIIGQEVIVLVKRSVRRPDKWEYLGFETIDEPEQDELELAKE
jgi:hypothetical protein